MLRLQHSRLSDVENISPKEKKRKKEKNIFFLTHHLRGALRKSLFSSSSHLKTFRKACYYQSIHFHFPLLPYFRNHVPEFSAPLNIVTSRNKYLSKHKKS